LYFFTVVPSFVYIFILSLAFRSFRRYLAGLPTSE
jgi:hypothetical protein